MRAREAAAWVARSVPPTATHPLVGRSRPPAIDSSVDFPDPLGPITATSSPASTASDTLSMATTSVRPWP
jgi:hypothetical protein